MSDSVTVTISSMLAPILADLKLELYDLDFNGGILKVTLDTPPGQPAGVDIDQIALVTRLLGRELDHNEDAVPGRFTLEVTSPGLERVLRTAHHFNREVGKEITVRFTSEFNGRRRLAGLLVAATDSTASVRVADTAETIEFPLSIVDKAKTVFVWESQPKPNSKEALAKRAASDKNASMHQQEASTQ
jgi:ribosome maturation factor RimP